MNMDTNTHNDEKDLDLNLINSLRKMGKEDKDTKKYFDAFINSTLVNLEDSKKALFNNNNNTVNSASILKQLKKLDIENISNLATSRIQLALNYMDQKEVDLYNIYFKERFKYKENEEAPSPPSAEIGEKISKEQISEYNKKVKEYNKNLLLTTEYNSKVNSILSTLENLVSVDIYGDQTLDISKLRYIYFKFFELDKTYIEMFIKDIKKTNADGLELIKRIDIDDISGLVPDNISNPFEVKFYFEDGVDAELMLKCNILFDSVYERFCQMSNLLKQGSADWGFDIQRQQNMNNINQSKSYQGTQNLQPYANPMNTATSNDVELLKEIDEDELEEEGFGYLKKQFSNTIDNGYLTIYSNETIKLDKIPLSHIPPLYSSVEHNRNGGSYKIVNICDGLRSMYIIEKPFKAYYDDSYDGIEYIGFDDGTIFKLDLYTYMEAQNHNKLMPKTDDEWEDLADDGNMVNDLNMCNSIENYVDHIII